LFDYVVVDGKIVTASWCGRANIAVKDGRIAAISTNDWQLEATDYYDANGKLVIPALVDTHVHLREPGYSHKEDFYTGTCAAAAGGYGTVVAQPNTSPPAMDRSSVKGLLELGQAQSVVDFAVSAQVTPDNIQSLDELKEAGALILDAATCDVPEDWLVLRGADFWEMFTNAARLGMPVAVYATDPSMVGSQTKALQDEGRVDPLAWVEARSPITEVTEVARLSQIAKDTRARVLFRQVSTALSLDILKATKSSSLQSDISVEVNPHHLFLTSKAFLRLGPLGKMAPPLRDRMTVEALWRALSNDTVDMIGGDHAPHTLEEKMAGKRDIWQAASGVPTLETALPLMLNAANQGRITIEKIVKLMSESPARWLNLYPCKGTIAVGSDADLVIIDPNYSWEIRGKDLLGKCKWTPFEGFTIKGRVERTMIRGNWVYGNGSILVKPGYGHSISAMKCNGRG